MTGTDPQQQVHTSKRSYAVLLQDDEAAEAGEGCVVVGSLVSEGAVKNSDLLAGIGEVGGLAPLPGNLSPEDLQLWQAARLVEIELPMDDLVTVQKVADVLGDSRSEEWSDELSQRLCKMAMDTEEADEPNACTACKEAPADDHLTSLLSLRPKLLAQVITRCMRLVSEEVYQANEDYDLEVDTTLTNLLTALPPPLHPDILDVAMDSGAPDLVFSEDFAQIVLSHLRRNPSPGSPKPPKKWREKLSISIVRVLSAEDSEASTAFSRPGMGGLLGRAISAHPGLINLRICGAPVSPQWLRALAACLSPGSLPHLRRFAINASAHPDTCAALSKLLALIPSIKELDVAFSGCDGTGNRTPDPAQLSSFRRITSRAHLPHLETLLYTDGAVKRADFYTDDYGCNWKLDNVDGCSCLHSFLSTISAPALDHLKFNINTSALRLQYVLAQLSRFPVARSLEIKIDMLSAGLDASMPHSIRAHPVCLPVLSEIDVRAKSAAVGAEVAGHLAGLAGKSLKKIIVGSPDRHVVPESTSDNALEINPLSLGWKTMFESIQKCTRLGELEFHSLCPVPDVDLHSYYTYGAGDRTFQFSQGLAKALAPLTRLRNLQLGHSYDQTVEFDAEVLGPALASLPALRCLQIGSHYKGDVKFADVQGIVDVCSGLERLEWLRIFSKDAEVGFEVFDEILPSLPHVKHVSLPSHLVSPLEDEGDELIEFKARYPSVLFTEY